MNRCPYCERAIEAADFEDVAKPGDLSVCRWCGASLVMEIDGGLRYATAAEEAELEGRDRTRFFDERVRGIVRRLLSERAS